ncbi:CRISPR-associated ring nuclease Csm6 [Laribacter hongkongensis]|uniref:CRISPR-associated ring nuclease Csm6 n=1 Tax=Laribacter hongkongensis TaxID=168471 RepID=UPI001EFD504A|nr:CRISPR-associated ring nuclease Csm6 [Laribacter hongkongensis]MCG9059804.1 CRISPR-associated ring nuclease Csm6 [Laribacter hongkongensis]MCG9084145.1 CRISPR-associated ring nuclease Csm6 [Laribacter hongkongensis]MCG9086544.1 CRISPR-associated ring nuclease Csm6 [Laribacter hongkongensis]
MTITRRKILLAVSGMTPQVVTETLYALATREDPWYADEVLLLSTEEGCQRARNELLHASRDMFGKFCREYYPDGHKVQFDENSLRPFCGPDGLPLADIRGLEESACVADQVARVVWELTQDDATELHASIAGGRKSMGFLLGYSMSLYGRPQDRLSHVLVTPAFESCNDFFYRPLASTIVHGRDNKPLDTDQAEVMLAEIPILHLRQKIPKPMLKKSASFSELVRVMNLAMEEPSIVFEPAHKRLLCHGVEIELSDLNYAFYMLLAEKQLANEDFFPEFMTDDEFISIKKFGKDVLRAEELEEESRAWLNDKDELSKEKKMRQFINDRKNQIKEILDAKLGLLGLQHYDIQAKNKRWSLGVESIQIR